MPSKLANYEAEMKADRDTSEMARILGVSDEVVSRIPIGSGSRLAAVVSILQRTLPNELALDYLNHPNPNFSGETPIALLLRGDSDRVEADLLALMEGVYL
jgi:hypothetical protein